MTGGQSNDSIPWPRFPAPVIRTWDLLPHWGNACLDIGTLHQTQLAPVTPAPLSLGDVILPALLTSARWIWRALFARWMRTITLWTLQEL
ncbi:hypothetical protein CDAR_196211 [Caerostris darwini]|uniref:Uncharacterized protein n=1 Tax=Caerostris darwini TaxID=1538125 RepID=A0AAV4MGH7_9ARAC|nr:hypothetical protein CDAR_196211 [Caerostris darwini]